MSEAKKVDTFRKDFSNKSKQRLKFSDRSGLRLWPVQVIVNEFSIFSARSRRI